MYCGKCGSQVDDGIKFCPKCGKDLRNINKSSANVSCNASDNQNNVPNVNLQTHYNPQGDVNNRQIPNNNFMPQNNYSELNTVSNKNKTEKSSIPSKIISIILCIFLFAFSFSALFIGMANTVLEKENLEKVCSKVELDKINISFNGKEETVSDLILEIAADSIIKKYDINKDNIETVLDDHKIRGYIEDITVDYIRYVFYNEESKNLNTDSIINILKKCADVVEDKTLYSFKESDYDDMKKELENGALCFLNVSDYDDSQNTALSVIRIIMSVPAIIILSVLAVAVMILILLCNKWKIKYLFAYSGMTFIITGSVFIFAPAVGFIVNMINDIYIFNFALKAVALNSLLFGFITLAVGVIMFIVYKTAFRRKKPALSE